MIGRAAGLEPAPPAPKADIQWNLADRHVTCRIFERDILPPLGTVMVKTVSETRLRASLRHAIAEGKVGKAQERKQRLEQAMAKRKVTSD